MQPGLSLGLMVSLVAVLSAVADDSASVPSTNWQAAHKQSSFDAWSPSARRTDIGFDPSGRSVWDFQQFMPFRTTDRDGQASRVYSENAALGTQSFDEISPFPWKALSLDSRYQLWDVPELPIAVGISIQPHTSDDKVQIAETFIIGRSYDFWKWAVNFTQGTEWSNRLKERDGDMELAWELARNVGKFWSVGIALRDRSELPEYRRLASNGVFLGPTIRCQHDKWWLGVSVMPRILHFDFIANSDSNRNVDFDSDQKLSTRMMFGMCW
jgi:hypothetical protein